MMFRVALLNLALTTATKPNLVLMVLDDLGWSDVGYHSSDFPTPNLDSLAQGGVRLERYYVQQVCSPTRSALMSGRYPFRTGLQTCNTIFPGSSAHLPTDQPTLAEALRDAGYATAMIGKWHLGYASWDYTPTGRGFDSYAGYMQGQVDYFTKELGIPGVKAGSGLDFWRNRTVARDAVGSYSMDFYMAEAQRILDERDATKPLFLYFAHQEIHVPLQASNETRFADRCKSVTATENRHTLCRMTSQLDESIGQFVEMLKAKDMWSNTLLWITTDNGGMAQFRDGYPASASSNFPLRAGKTTLFEGGVRGISLVAGGLLPVSAAGTQVTDLLQHVDIPATLAALGNASLPLTDGFNVWQTLTQGAQSPRTEIPVNVDPTDCSQANATSFSALISGDWKLISGFAGMYDGWWSNGDYMHEQPDSSAAAMMVNGKTVWLFDIRADPTERKNLAKDNFDVVAKMEARLAEYAGDGFAHAQDNTPSPAAFPFLHQGVWAPWKKSTNANMLVV